MKHLLISTLLLGSHLQAAEPQQFNLAKRASEIDPRAKEHSAIKFTFIAEANVFLARQYRSGYELPVA